MQCNQNGTGRSDCCSWIDEEVTIRLWGIGGRERAWFAIRAHWAWLPLPNRVLALFFASLVVSFSHCDLFCVFFLQLFLRFFFISVFLHVVSALIDRNLTKAVDYQLKFSLFVLLWLWSGIRSFVLLVCCTILKFKIRLFCGQVTALFDFSFVCFSSQEKQVGVAKSLHAVQMSAGNDLSSGAWDGNFCVTVALVAARNLLGW